MQAPVSWSHSAPERRKPLNRAAFVDVLERT
jgi:hypothetical protein